MKKVIALAVIVAALLIGAIVYSDLQNKQLAEGNPYGKATLNPATIEQLHDPLYDNQILPNQLQEALTKQGDLFVYFYSPTCEYCREMTPVLVPTANELQIEVKKHNLLEFPNSWNDYGIEYTPTLVHYKDGVEVSRLVGGQTADELKKWFALQLPPNK
jgi:thioredoxin 1